MIKKSFALRKSHGFVMLSALGFSFILIFSTFLKNSGMSSLQQVLFRIGISLAMLSLILFSKKQLYFPRKEDLLFFSAFGLVSSLFLLTALSPLVFGVPIAVAIALTFTQPIFTALISHFTKKERVTSSKLCVILVGIVGAFLVTGMEVSEIINLNVNPGIAFALSSGFLYAAYLWLKRNAIEKKYTPFQTLFNTFLFALLFTMVIGVILRNFTSNPLLISIKIPSAYEWVLLFLFATVCTVLPYGVLNYVMVEEISPTTEGLLLLGDPLLHIVWAILFFQQFVSFPQYFGAFLILLSAAIDLKIAAKH